MGFTLPGAVRRPGYFGLLVTGGRDYADEYAEMDALDRVYDATEARELQLRVIQGGATGADAIARMWAWSRNVHIINVPVTEADWQAYGRAAGPRRNQLMVDRHEPDACLAMPGGRGTRDCVERCRAAGVAVWTLEDIAAASLSRR